MRFGVFEVDLRAGELCKQGRKVRLQEQPLQILAALLERPGELVTREELRQRLWPGDTFVDFNHGLNAAIKRLRDALGDSAENPRFVETVARRGYRFIAPVDDGNRSQEIAKKAEHEAETSGPIVEEMQAPAPTSRQARWPLMWRKGAIAAAALIFLAVVISVWMIRPQRRPVEQPASAVLAVLPFVNLSPDAENEYFSDGLTEEIIQSLSVIDGLEVTSRTSSFALKGTRLDVREIAGKLNASMLLEGSVRKAGDELRITAQLIHTPDGKHIWSSTYDRKMQEVFAIQEEIAGSIADALRLKFGTGQRRYTNNLEAYQLYLRGRYALERSLGGNMNSLQYFEQAIAKDADYALAYAGAADALLAMHMSLLLPYSEAYPRAKAAAEKALQLDPMLSEAHTAMAMVHAREEYARQEAEKSFRRAIALNPNNALAHRELGNPFLVVQGRFDEGIEELRRAVMLDPLSGVTSALLAEALLLAGHYGEAIDQARKAVVLDPNLSDGYVVEGRALYLAGRNAEALSVMHEADLRSTRGGSTGWLACANVRAGRRTEALEILEKNLQGAYRNPPPARNLVRIYACLGDADHAIEYLEKMYAEHQPGLPVFFRYPELAWMGSDPRFALLRRKVGLEPYSIK